MFIKVPVYVDYRGSIHDPALLHDVCAVLVEKLVLSGKPEKKLIISPRQRRMLKEQGIDPGKLLLVSRSHVIDGLR